LLTQSYAYLQCWLLACTLCYVLTQLLPAEAQPEELYWSGKSQPPNPPTALALAQYEQSSSSDTSSISSSSSDAHSDDGSSGGSSDSSHDDCATSQADVIDDVADALTDDVSDLDMNAAVATALKQQVHSSSAQSEVGSNAAYDPKAKPLISTSIDDDILQEQVEELSPFAKAWEPPTTAAPAAPTATATPATAAAISAVATTANGETAAVQALLAAALKSSSDVSQLSADVAYTPYPAPGPSDCTAVLKLYMHASSFAQQVAVWQQQQQ
jgi:hypothetical protein